MPGTSILWPRTGMEKRLGLTDLSLSRNDISIHDLPFSADLRPASADDERPRADVLDFIEVIAAICRIPQDLVVIDLQRCAAAGCLLELHHGLRHEVIDDLADVHADYRL